MTKTLTRRHLLSIPMAFGTWDVARALQSLTVLLPEDVLRDFRRFLSGRQAEALRDFSGPFSRRDVVEVALLHLALAAEGPDAGLNLQVAPTSARLYRELRLGHAACSGTTFWREDFVQAGTDLLFSRAVLEDGEFEAGLYTHADNQRVMATKRLSDLQAMSALCNRDWRVDWETLQQLGVREIHHVGSWELMPRMLAGGRADFVLAPFQATSDLSLHLGGVKLVPIPGIKVLLRGTRHYLVSARHPGAADLKARLDDGIARLRAQGVLRRAYVESGFINPAVADWTILRRP